MLTFKVIVSPASISSFSLTLCSITYPASTFLLNTLSSSVMFTINPNSSNAAIASSSVFPTTFGTTTMFLPWLTTTVIVSPSLML